MQANNAVIRTWGEKRLEPKLKNHVELVELLGIADIKKGNYIFQGYMLYSTKSEYIAYWFLRCVNSLFKLIWIRF